MSKIKKAKKIQESETDSTDDSTSGNSSSSSEKSSEVERKRAKKHHKHKDKLSKNSKKKKDKSKKKKKHHEHEPAEMVNSRKNSPVLTDNEREREQDIKTRRRKDFKNEKEKAGSKWESPQRKRSRSHSVARQRPRVRSRSPQRIYSRERMRAKSSERDYRRHQDDLQTRDKYIRRDYQRNGRDGGGYNQRYERRQYSRSPRRSHDHSRERNYKRRDKYSPRDNRNRRDDDDAKNHEWGTFEQNRDEKKRYSKNTEATNTKPDYGLSGLLAEETNKVNGVVIKYSEPPEARKPKRRWRLYPFKGETALPVLHIHRQSCFLVGRDRKVADLAVDHPSCSKQHAALQYRLVPFQRDDGSHGKRVRLYVIDLESANGTFLNNKRIDSRKYYELMEKDVIKFGFSTREYVLLHENSKEDQEDDDVPVKEEPQE